jgi:hypothetical protein
MDRRARQRVALVVLLVGAAGVAASLLGGVPPEHRVRVRIVDPASLRRLELSWQDADGDQIRRSEWFFSPPRTAPESIELGLRARPGRYRAVMTWERVGQPPRTDERRVDLASEDRIDLPVP